MTPDFSNIMKQAKSVQENIQKIQEELKSIEVTGEAGAGLAKVTISGKNEVRRIEIDDSLFEEEKSVLEDLVAAAVNDAIRKVERTHKEKMSSMAGGFDLGSMMNAFK